MPSICVLTLVLICLSPLLYRLPPPHLYLYLYIYIVRDCPNHMVDGQSQLRVEFLTELCK